MFNIFKKKKQPVAKKDFQTWYSHHDSEATIKLLEFMKVGKKLSKKSIDEFWSLFHQAQCEAFNAGQE